MDQLLIETYGTAVSKAFSGVNSTNAVALVVFLFIYDRAWLTSECSLRYDNFGTVRQAIA